MIITGRAAAAAAAVLFSVLALSGCGSREAQTQSASSTSEAIATTASTTATSAATPAGEKVAAADLPAIVSDRTFRGEDEGESYSEYYAADGTLRGTSGGQAYSGSWNVVGEELCFSYPDEGSSATECYAVFKNGDALTWVRSDGRLVEAIFVEGNPDGL
jgi:hypothetical protein